MTRSFRAKIPRPTGPVFPPATWRSAFTLPDRHASSPLIPIIHNYHYSFSRRSFRHRLLDQNWPTHKDPHQPDLEDRFSVTSAYLFYHLASCLLHIGRSSPLQPPQSKPTHCPILCHRHNLPTIPCYFRCLHRHREPTSRWTSVGPHLFYECQFRRSPLAVCSRTCRA